MINLRRFLSWWREVLQSCTIMGMPLKRTPNIPGEGILSHLKTLLKE